MILATILSLSTGGLCLIVGIWLGRREIIRNELKRALRVEVDMAETIRALCDQVQSQRTDIAEKVLEIKAGAQTFKANVALEGVIKQYEKTISDLTDQLIFHQNLLKLLAAVEKK